MTKEHLSGEMRMIPVDLIDVLNPRDRNKRVFDEIVANIKTIGLKRPITVTPRTVADGADRYLLVCGEGRLNAYRTLGETTIPAMVVKVSDEDAFIMSLAENIARRQCRPLELLAGIEQLTNQGYDKKAIVKKDRAEYRLRLRHPETSEKRRGTTAGSRRERTHPAQCRTLDRRRGQRRQGGTGRTAGSL